MSILPLKIKNLNYQANRKYILKNINLSSNERKITIIAGNNGSGKTTFLQILHGLINSKENVIKWGNYSVTQIKKNQSMVFQSPILLNRTAQENLSYVASKKNITDKNFVREIMNKLNIKHIANINTKYISGGEKQKLAIAMAILGKPKIIFLDEPTSQLDPVYKNEIESIIKNLSENNVKIFMTTHDISQIKRMGEEIIFLDKGNIIYQNKVKKFFTEQHVDLIKNYINYG